MKIDLAISDQDIAQCFELMTQLRPHLSQDQFVAQVIRMRDSVGYQLARLQDEGVIKALAGLRVSEWLHTGKYLEIEELVTDELSRSQGYGSVMFDWCRDYAKELRCNELRLVSGVKRRRAHQFYLSKGMRFEAKYFSMTIE